jgi:hypothetical protein
MEIKRLLKYFAKHGYPSPETLTIMEYSAYNPENFLSDLVNEIGHENSVEFVRKTFNKLSSGINSEIQIKIPLDNTVYPGSWIGLIINNFEINLNEEPNDVLINSNWGDSYFIHPETGETGTFEDAIGDEDPWDYSDFMDGIRSDSYDYIQKMCGFGIWFV